MAKADPVPVLYGKAFDRLADVSGRLRGLRSKTMFASEPPPSPSCVPEADPLLPAAVDDPVPCAKPDRRIETSFEELLLNLRTLL